MRFIAIKDMVQPLATAIISMCLTTQIPILIAMFVIVIVTAYQQVLMVHIQYLLMAMQTSKQQKLKFIF